uniref:Heat shock 70 kDa protein 12B n=1 Tax=Magallana gigas TaxID=29159 RepID=A0A8W8L658_MAGGI
MLALVPEAALFYCMHLPVHEVRYNSTYGVVRSEEKYMVVVAGDEKIDISVHEVVKNGSVKTLSTFSGCDCGESKLDALFLSLLADIVGKDVMDSFSSTHKYDLDDLLRGFKVKKKKIRPELNEHVSILVPASLRETYFKKNPGKRTTNVISLFKYKDQVTWRCDKLRMNAHIVKALFDRCCKQIVDHLKELFMHPAVKEVSSILLVGEFAESPMLQTAIREAFNSKNVIIPEDPSLAVIKGAALFRHQPGKTSGTSKSFFLVAAIDFGTTFSGYAFSFRHDYMKDPLNISTFNWCAGSGGLVSLKTSTCVLFDPTGKFYSFGYGAEEKYSNLALDDEHHDWFYFYRFKMMLYNKKDLTRETLIEDDKGKKIEAIKVFSSAIGYIKDQLLNHCKKQTTGIEESDVVWVLTVPAIWNDNSKQFMREAAEKV